MKRISLSQLKIDKKIFIFFKMKNCFQNGKLEIYNSLLQAYFYNQKSKIEKFQFCNKIIFQRNLKHSGFKIKNNTIVFGFKSEKVSREHFELDISESFLSNNTELYSLFEVLQVKGYQLQTNIKKILESFLFTKTYSIKVKEMGSIIGSWFSFTDPQIIKNQNYIFILSKFSYRHPFKNHFLEILSKYKKNKFGFYKEKIKEIIKVDGLIEQKSIFDSSCYNENNNSFFKPVKDKTKVKQILNHVDIIFTNQGIINKKEFQNIFWECFVEDRFFFDFLVIKSTSLDFEDIIKPFMIFISNTSHCEIVVSPFKVIYHFGNFYIYPENIACDDIVNQNNSKFNFSNFINKKNKNYFLNPYYQEDHQDEKYFYSKKKRISKSNLNQSNYIFRSEIKKSNNLIENINNDLHLNLLDQRIIHITIII